MGEPTDEIECVGGPADGIVYATTARYFRIPAVPTPEEFAARLRASSARNIAWALGEPEPDVPTPPMRFHTYADTGRRTADGRRVFAVEGG